MRFIMADEINTPLIAATADIMSKLSPQAVASAKEGYMRAGYSVEEIDAAFNRQTGSPIVETKSHTMMAMGGADGITAQEKERGYRALLESGSVDRDTILRAAAKDGVQLTEAPSKEVQQASAEHAILKGFEPPVRPENYRIEVPNFALDLPTEDVATVLNDMRHAFHAAGVPATMGTGLAAALLGSMDRFDSEAGEVAIKTQLAEEGARVRKLSGDYKETARLAEIGIAALPEATRSVIYEGYGFHSAEAFLAMSNFGRIVEERSKRSAK
jgi:hypothetical protein